MMSETEKAKVFRDKVHPAEWRVKWFDAGGACEVAIFAGPRAEERARRLPIATSATSRTSDEQAAEKATDSGKTENG